MEDLAKEAPAGLRHAGVQVWEETPMMGSGPKHTGSHLP